MPRIHVKPFVILDAVEIQHRARAPEPAFTAYLTYSRVVRESEGPSDPVWVIWPKGTLRLTAGLA